MYKDDLKRKAGLIHLYSTYFSFKGTIFSLQSFVGEVSKPSLISQRTDFKRCGFWHLIEETSKADFTESWWVHWQQFQLCFNWHCVAFFTYSEEVKDFWNFRQPMYQTPPPEVLCSPKLPTWMWLHSKRPTLILSSQLSPRSHRCVQIKHQAVVNVKCM